MIEATTDNWSTLDPWWGTYVATASPMLANSDTLTLDSKWLDDISEGTDPWWGSFAELRSRSIEEMAVLGTHAVDGRWEILDPWWKTYISAREEDVAELMEVLNDSNTLWEHRGGYLDADPLSTNWGQEMRAGDPLQPEPEEDWSDWLAQLLRSDAGLFHGELFGEDIGTPRSVKREDYLPKTGGTNRYADVVVITRSRGISIEVKIGDTNYGKTTDTVELLEDKYSREWRHYLLLPEWNISALRASIDDDEGGEGDAESSKDEDERPTLTTEGTAEVEVVHWGDVSRALRTILLDSTEQDPHWAASAYLFCTQIERKILGFSSKPVIERLAAGADAAAAFESVSVAIGDLESQTEYLKEFIEDDTNE